MKKAMIRVDSGTTLDGLAEKYHTTPLAIKKLNNLNTDLFVGMRLIVEENQGEYYTVQPFDTLESIVSKFGANLQRTKDLNGLERVFIGQKIFIPIG
ncbi:MAG: LysM peptidoglycan-binding domain-containing protein [Clostridia bacterium]|nr:LysM peptidoglycan-binding domain-containing protein [Clostridia bacterium]MDE6472107.1 LysM peptidoglycan-binding domain-containing protein [Clostridia bacterium]